MWFKRRPDPEYNLLWHMGRVQQVIRDLDLEVRWARGTPLVRYWERKWAEAVMLHMEFEWYFHPANEEGFRR